MPDAPDLGPHRAEPTAFVTAPAWNALREAILGAYACLNAALTVPGYLVISVRDRATDALLDPAAIASVTATATAAPGLPFSAQLMGRFFVIANLPPGDYDVTATPAEELGLVAEVRRATVRAGEPTELTFALGRPPARIVSVPELFQVTLFEALDRLVEVGLRPGAVLDAHGTEVTLLQVGDRWQPAQAEQGQLRVINLEPGVGTQLAAGLPVDLLVTATPEQPGG